MIPELYLHGLAEGDFELALRGLLGEGAPPSKSSAKRLRRKWVVEHERWEKRANKERLAQIERQLKRIDAEIAKLLRREETLKRRFDILASIPGFSNVTAVGRIVHMPELGTMTGPRAASLAAASLSSHDAPAVRRVPARSSANASFCRCVLRRWPFSHRIASASNPLPPTAPASSLPRAPGPASAALRGPDTSRSPMRPNSPTRSGIRSTRVTFHSGPSPRTASSQPPLTIPPSSPVIGHGDPLTVIRPKKGERASLTWPWDCPPKQDHLG